MIICTFQYRVERSRHFESALVIKNGALFMGDSIQANKKSLVFPQNKLF
ncbi:hypothetical protein B600_0319 [Chlamydia psittaci VS225]|nr:hypothetical protein B600_0319 [Chlamydia psittaci VS225]